MKISELLEATMTPGQIAAKKAAAPYGYNAQTGKPNPAPAGQQAPAQQAAPQAKQQPAQQQAAPVDPVQQKSNEIEQRMLDRMGARFGLKPGATAEQVQAAQQAYLDKNDPQAAAQYKQNMSNIDAGNTADNKPVQLQQPQQQTQTQQAQPQSADERLKQGDPDFYAGLQAQKAGGSPVDIMLAQPSIANNQKLLDAIGSAYGLPAGSTVQQIKAAAGGQKAQPQQQAMAEGLSRILELSGQIKLDEFAPSNGDDGDDDDIELPYYDSTKKTVWRDGISKGKKQKFADFKAVDTGRAWAIVGITFDGGTVKISHTPSKELAQYLTSAYLMKNQA